MWFWSFKREIISSSLLILLNRQHVMSSACGKVSNGATKEILILLRRAMQLLHIKPLAISHANIYIHNKYYSIIITSVIAVIAADVHALTSRVYTPSSWHGANFSRFFHDVGACCALRDHNVPDKLCHDLIRTVCFGRFCCHRQVPIKKQDEHCNITIKLNWT